jgi:VWFA-related protein
MHLVRPVTSLLLACLIVPVSMASGPSQAVSAPPSQASAGQSGVVASDPASTPNSGKTVLRLHTNLVLVDVVVTDHGNAVHDLDRRRFHVFEDGHEQEITTFEEHQPHSTLATAAAVDLKPVPLPPHTYTNVPRYQEASAVNVLLLDGLNTPVADQMNVRHQMIEYLGRIQPGASLAIFVLASQLRQVTGFTTDVSELAKGIESPKATAQPSVILDPQGDQDLDNTIGDMATLGVSQKAVQAMQQFQADLTAYQTDQRVRMTLNAMQQLARYLNAVPGRKNLIWFSGSFPIALDPDSTLTNPFQAMRNYTDDIRETAELLSAARVAVYPVDARGLMTMKSVDASYTPSTNLMSPGSGSTRRGNKKSPRANVPNPGKDDAKFLNQTVAEQASMQQIAEQTGGQAYVNSNGLEEAVASAIENGASYYTIGYLPAAKQFDGEFRKIELHADNAAYKLSYRHGYYADPQDKPTAHQPGAVSLIVASTLHGAPPSTQILFQARVLPSTDPVLQGANLPGGPAGEMSATLKSPIHRVIVDLKVDPHGIAWQDAPDGAHGAQIEYTLLAYDADGKRLNWFDKGFQLKLNPEQYSHSISAGIPMRVALDLPAGNAFLRIAVHDLNAGSVGSLEIPVADPSR